ncbi:helix-turn-helix domain-containing protein [Candidatus Uhrbacteria bacterium]|nr:helix-turn-helix domain-containing protein [Candidatus Uhrbacteria bacterium]
MITKKKLELLYLQQGRSQQDIANAFGCSLNRVAYWVKKHGIRTRSISDAVYLKCNPDGDPFHFIGPQTLKEAKLFGIGLGLYWGKEQKLVQGLCDWGIRILG